MKKFLSLILIISVLLTNMSVVTSVSAEILSCENTVSCGEENCVSLKNDNSLWAWGKNSAGIFGNNEGTDFISHTPIKIMEDVILFERGGDADTYAVIKSDNSLWMWGYIFNASGSIYINGKASRTLKRRLHATPQSIMDNVKNVYIGDNYYAAIKTDGSLWTWGYNESGKLGNGTTDDSLTPIKIMDNVVSVDLTNGHSAAIKSDGSLWMWGDNNYGQLGNGTTDNSLTPIKIMDNVVSVDLTNGYSAAIKNDGSLWMWGNNNYGQLGNGTTDNSLTPIKIMDNVKSVSLRGSQTAIIKHDGSLFLFGNLLWGQLNSESNKVQLNNVASIDLQDRFCVAVTNDGALYVWGWMRYGFGEEYSYDIPTLVTNNVTAVNTFCDIEDELFAITKKDGSLWTFGYNNCGQLGNGTTESSRFPIKIMDGVKIPSTANIVTIPTTPSVWAEDEINQAILHELIPEELQSNYQSPITRLDFCKLALTLYKKITGKTGIIGISNKFHDLSGLSTDDSFTIDVVSDLGIVNGYEDGTFRPYKEISRQEAAVMLMRTAKVLGLGEFIDNYANVYDDCGDVADWAMEGIKYVCNASIMNGSNSWIETNPDGYTTKANHITFSPYDNYTREQAMITYYRLYNKLITSNDSSTHNDNYKPSQVPTSVEVQDLSNIADTFNFSVSQYIDALKSVDVSDEDDTKTSKKQEALNKVKTVDFNIKMMPQYTQIKNLGIADELETVFYDALFDFYMSYSIKEKGKKYYDDIQPSDFSDGGLSASSKIVKNTGEYIGDILEDKSITNTYVAGKNTYEVTIEMPIGGIGFINAKFVDKKNGAEYTYNGTQGDNSGIQTVYSYMQNYVDELIELYKKANINVAQTAINEIIEIFDSVSFTNSKKISKLDIGEQTAYKLKEMGLGEVDEFIGYCVEVHNLVKDWKNLTDSMKKEDVHDVYEKAQKVYNNINSSFGNSISGNPKQGSVEFVNSLQKTVYEKLGELIEYCKVYIETH